MPQHSTQARETIAHYVVGVELDMPREAKHAIDTLMQAVGRGAMGVTYYDNDGEPIMHAGIVDLLAVVVEFEALQDRIVELEHENARLRAK